MGVLRLVVAACLSAAAAAVAAAVSSSSAGASATAALSSSSSSLLSESGSGLPSLSGEEGGACAATNCADCSADLDCTWCANTKRCEPGDWTGPDAGFSSCPNWFWKQCILSGPLTVYGSIGLIFAILLVCVSTVVCCLICRRKGTCCWAHRSRFEPLDVGGDACELETASSYGKRRGKTKGKGKGKGNDKDAADAEQREPSKWDKRRDVLRQKYVGNAALRSDTYDPSDRFKDLP
eukprot:TRINITY_DN9543_c0_g1_i1.p1 TRINITY_DN9543_c0_g1~~TRINITY_DN9543_c0_g1_i1.p1  ORF type:complete len:236 (+),score=61.59 TRINITY_DN9543_c0_g1_i1:14-721(+)